jgi:alpha-tubulin suppressor-like RCC1 family protein
MAKRDGAGAGARVEGRGRATVLVAVAAALVAAVLLALPAGLTWVVASTGDDRSDGPRTAGPRPGSVAAGTTHSCAIAPRGALRCWGGNADLQLGTGLRTWSRVPLNVIRLETGAAAVTAGGSHTCALSVAGAVTCWSREGRTLGVGDATISTAAPVAVAGMTAGVVAVSAGSGHTCALTGARDVLCWGEFHGRDLKPRNYLSPRKILGLGRGVRAINAGFDDACAVTAAGSVRCWGEHYPGPRGASPVTAVTVTGLTAPVTAVAVGGGHACALTVAGGVQCWGENAHGQVGNGTTTAAAKPVPVSGLDAGVVALSAGYQSTCALTASGGVSCWGHNEYGQLGDGTTTDAPKPVPVVGLGSEVVSLSAGFQHACAMTRDGGVKCWGYNFEGQLGIGASTLSSSPTPLDVVRL